MPAEQRLNSESMDRISELIRQEYIKLGWVSIFTTGLIY